IFIITQSYCYGRWIFVRNNKYNRTTNNNISHGIYGTTSSCSKFSNKKDAKQNKLLSVLWACSSLAKLSFYQANKGR
ncbi:MAG: hypothetical protein PHN41_06400, partial [Bacteroidales bacterium]|nr:hypothetical protein [Bacteroidales bacterium]MDD4704040.1 hypothetical protein [Bacteroidales bacterium]